ncbi:30S ribosomal protein S9 [Flavobacteriales bacterium]|jgi:small subunit ribosomal protein S9|nr:30S ribosomal protein S9 [Flavobacteriales bacterium]|tara:strand:- start:1280 stop:1666 length:387 start_codon:yes stop_codon:yes gene_type:complete
METIHTIGRRKASVARIYLNKGKGAITINKKDYKDFFPVEGLQKKVLQPFSILDLEGKFDVKVNVNGGGNTGQADAIKLAIARALCELDLENRPALKAEGLLTRDPRVVERKKPGQKKARKKFQWVKR